MLGKILQKAISCVAKQGEKIIAGAIRLLTTILNFILGKLPSLQPNRTETIIDPETQNVVFNEYKNGCVVRSTLKDTKGKILYELDFKDNKILKSRNYNLKGQLTIEEVFYENGQVHYRNEYTPKGKITTEFDKNGNKK